MNHRNLTIRSASGFTLMELMIVIAIVAILTMVSMPQYSSYVVRGKRAAAQQVMLDMSGAIEMYRMDRRQFPAALGNGADELAFTLPPEVAGSYVISYTVNNAAAPPTYLLTATPLAGSSQADDGVLTINNHGIKTPAHKWQ